MKPQKFMQNDHTFMLKITAQKLRHEELEYIDIYSDSSISIFTAV